MAIKRKGKGWKRRERGHCWREKEIIKEDTLGREEKGRVVERGRPEVKGEVGKEGELQDRWKERRQEEGGREAEEECGGGDTRIRVAGCELPCMDLAPSLVDRMRRKEFTALAG